MTAFTEVSAAALCPACPHSARLHGDVGCRTCDCGLTGGEILGAPVTATVAVAPPTPRSLDRLDPECACGHRRGLHRQSGSSAPCRRCTCRNFTAEREPDASTVAPPAEPAPRVDPVPAATNPDDHDDSSRRPTPADTTAAPVAALTRPRLHQPRTVGTALMEPTGPGEGDADQGVTAAGSSPAAVAPDLLDAALWLSARWYCPSCIQWPHDPGACSVCRTPLQPVYLVTIPREPS